MTQLLIDRTTLEQLVDCPASDYERMYALKKQLRAALGNAEPKKVEKREPRIDLGRYAGTYGGYTTPTKDTVGDDAKNELGDLILAWVKKHVNIRYWKVGKVQECKITAEDLE